MQFLDLNREYKYFDWIAAIKPVFDSKQFINGPQVKEFEQKLAEYIGTDYALGVSSGTDALQVALLAKMLDKKEQVVVLTTPYSFIATVEMPFRLGCKVIFCDIDESFNIDMNRVKEVISTHKVDIFLPVHLFGKPCALDEELIRLCKEKNVAIIEDCAQAIGTKYAGTKVGAIGEMGCFSFFPAKNLGCAGDAGAITTNSQDIYEKCIMLRNHGGKVKYQHSCHGGNFRLDTIQAALLLAKLPYLDTWINNRVATAEIYSDCFYSLIDERDCPRKGIFTVTCPESKPLDFCTYNQYVIRVESDTRDDLVKYLNGHNVPTAIYYPLCLSEQPCYRGVNFECDCVGSKLAARQNIALPIAHLTTDEIELVTSTIRKFYE